MSAGVFVTGTDTGVGKTAVAAGIAASLVARGVDVHPLKPVETGWPAGQRWPSDAAILAHAAGRGDLTREQVCPVALEEPLAPTVAARRAGQTIDIERLDAAFQQAHEASELVLVEGAGGLLVPITDELTMADLAARWQLPVLVVARPCLGTLNHTALTVQAARAHDLQVLGIVIDRYPEDPGVAARTNPAELEHLTQAPVLGCLPELPSLDPAQHAGADPSRRGSGESAASGTPDRSPPSRELIDAVEEQLTLTPILDLIQRSDQRAQASPTHDE